MQPYLSYSKSNFDSDRFQKKFLARLRKLLLSEILSIEHVTLILEKLENDGLKICFCCSCFVYCFFMCVCGRNVLDKKRAGARQCRHPKYIQSVFLGTLSSQCQSALRPGCNCGLTSLSCSRTQKKNKFQNVFVIFFSINQKEFFKISVDWGKGGFFGQNLTQKIFEIKFWKKKFPLPKLSVLLLERQKN